MILPIRPASRPLAARLGIAALVATLALGLATAPVQAETPVAKLTEVTAGAGDLHRVFFGKVVARETVDLPFQVTGQVVTFPVEEGAEVPKGGLVAAMDLEPFELALEEADARAAAVGRTLDRYQQLVGSAVSESNLEDAETQVELAMIAQQNAERALRNATLHAPFDAIVARRLVPNYSTVSAGTPVVRLHDMSDLRIEIDVPETLFHRALQDPALTLTAEFPASDRIFPLEIREYNAETAEVGQTYRLTLGMEPPEDITILPGASAKVSARLTTGAGQIVLPASAIVIGNDDRPRVMLFEPAGAEVGTVRATPVEISPTDRGTVEVTAGLQPGQEVVAIGGAQLSDGAQVRRFTGFED
ncbi:efflux RND transporter periplasmic adaptor subunit [Thalassorhabdomicrobium marinisediminis]|uniref:Efflux RND transporter periplasmic adaptor subunit n=1 Tax=Thalassorhabdomicrobium marinisediminis TaxID=2170577 RepID=A0A2T7FZ03_9RHOB|nr:efflux RND transporter periplasmic adaptor subunit [Thalassorhabdomicrobium marinisediminis]PVA07396.1 efflux RND transporter periplasmic adaptor subunit [Thalassorhabdomicrobium marinisediminis]